MSRYRKEKGVSPVIATILMVAITVVLAATVYMMVVVDPPEKEIIGSLKGTFYMQPNLFALAFQVFAIIISLISGIIFSIRTMKSDDPQVKLKGKFLLIAFVSFTVGALADAIIPMTPVTLVIVRLILISSAIEYYFGFLIPKKLSDWLINE